MWGSADSPARLLGIFFSLPLPGLLSQVSKLKTQQKVFVFFFFRSPASKELLLVGIFQILVRFPTFLVFLKIALMFPITTFLILSTLCVISFHSPQFAHLSVSPKKPFIVLFFCFYP